MNHTIDDLAFLPPHEVTAIPGFHAYSNQLRVRPGEVVELCISNEGPVNTNILKLGVSTQDVAVIATLPRVEAQLQTVARGSYVHIENGIQEMPALTVEVWCRPLTNAKRRGLIAQSGLFELSLEADNAPYFSIGSTPAFLHGGALTEKEWHHLIGRWDGSTLSLFVDGSKVSETPHQSTPVAGNGPIRLGALSNADGEASAFYTGDLWAPCVYMRALFDEEIATRSTEKSSAAADGAVGKWKFDSIEGEPYRDVSSAQRHGQPVNYPLRMIPGPGRTEDSDWCTYDPTTDPHFGYAVRFMEDAFLDCRWPVSTMWQVPENIAPGQYAARLTNEAGEERDVYFLIVPSQPRARLLCLSTTNTRVAYNFQPFGNTDFDYGAYQAHPSYPMLGHLIGSRRPNTGEPWERQTIDFELPYYAWLDRESIAYDLYSEWDLEENPKLLEHYDVVSWSGHSEYWTALQYESLQAFVKRGGHLISLSGNSAYWRVSIDAANSVIEVRKHARVPTPGTTFDPTLNSAHWHQMDLMPGVTMREASYPEHRLLCNVTNGYTDPPLDGPRYGYEVLQPAHPLFHGPRAVESAGNFAPDAAGYETDLSCRSMLERFGPITTGQYPSRDGAPQVSLADNFDEGLTILARAKLPDSTVVDYNNVVHRDEMWSEMIVWERPGHGVVFCTGSVLSSEILLSDRNFSNFLLNVFNFVGLDTGPEYSRAEK